MDFDPERLSYVVASAIAVEMPEKQKLLELTRTDERLKAEASILSKENRALQTFVYLREQQKRDPPQDDNPWRHSRN